jgi:hypothetical protein
MGVVHSHVGDPFLEKDAANMFRFSDPGSLAKLLHSAGFVEVEEEMKRLPWIWPGTVEELWEYAQAVSTPFRPLLGRIADRQRVAIDREVHAALRQFEDRGRLKLEAVVGLARGSKA